MSKQVFIDSINGKYARLLYENEEFVLPCCLLPKGAKEGDVLSWSLEIDRQQTENGKKECADLLKQLLDNNH